MAKERNRTEQQQAEQAGIVARSGATWVNGKMICPFCNATLDVRGSHTSTESIPNGRKRTTIVRNCRCRGARHGAPHTFKHLESIYH